MNPAAEAVLDASALIALLWDEPGAAAVEPLLGRAVISAVNWTEVLQRYEAHGVSSDGTRDDVEGLGIRIEPFTQDDAGVAAKLWPATHDAGLSLGDRACLALAKRLGIAAHTADRAWRQAETGTEIVVIR